MKNPKELPSGWKSYVLGLPQHTQLNILMSLLHWQIDELKGQDIRFSPGEDPDYQGTYTANADIYWTSHGKSLLNEDR